MFMYNLSKMWDDKFNVSLECMWSNLLYVTWICFLPARKASRERFGWGRAREHRNRGNKKRYRWEASPMEQACYLRILEADPCSLPVHQRRPGWWPVAGWTLKPIWERRSKAGKLKRFPPPSEPIWRLPTQPTVVGFPFSQLASASPINHSLSPWDLKTALL